MLYYGITILFLLITQPTFLRKNLEDLGLCQVLSGYIFSYFWRRAALSKNCVKSWQYKTFSSVVISFFYFIMTSWVFEKSEQWLLTVTLADKVIGLTRSLYHFKKSVLGSSNREVKFLKVLRTWVFFFAVHSSSQLWKRTIWIRKFLKI